MLPSDMVDKKVTEDVMLELCQKIFVHLCRQDEIVLENKYSRHLKDMPALRTGSIGMGNLQTWRGTPDARVRGCEVLKRQVSCIQLGSQDSDSDSEDLVNYESWDENSESASSSDGAAVELEAKKKSSASNLPQVIATTVVASFTHKKRHSSQQALVPAILIDLKMCQVCLYDCELDILLISASKSLGNKERLSRSAMLFLWLTINHR